MVSHQQIVLEYFVLQYPLLAQPSQYIQYNKRTPISAAAFDPSSIQGIPINDSDGAGTGTGR